MAEASESRVQQSQPQSAAARRLELGALASAKPRSLWSDAFRQFRRHRLAMAGSIMLLIMILAVLIGPFIWPKGTGNIDFANGLRSPSLEHPWAPTTWVATCSRGF
jgi:peptide/nickel transport system permease protein